MTAMELRKRKRNPKEEAAYFSSACKDKDGFDVKYINPDKSNNIAETNALVSANSVLAEKDQMQPEELHPQAPRDATHKVPAEGPFASPMTATLPPVKEMAQSALVSGTSPALKNLKRMAEIGCIDEINTTDDSDASEPENSAMDDAMSVPRQTGIQKTQTDTSSAAGCSDGI
ncbi:hypothetical protein SRHO_G00080740 [Serrasalmus rhombeus]